MAALSSTRPRRVLFAVALLFGTAVCALAALLRCGPAFAGGSAAFAVQGGRRTSPARAAATANVLDTLIHLPDMLTDVVEDVQDMFGQGSTGLPKMEVSTLSMAEDGLSPSAIMQTMSLRAAAGSERRLARQVSRLIDAARASGTVLTATATQSEEDPCDFMVLLRYKSMHHMHEHQVKGSFKEALEQMEPQLDRPIGLYLIDEHLGQTGMARYPFGPGGEGGRDDAIYSSRKRR
mmetsp:Transcript_1201/g.2647  ORF Transcript_1201/g.2647 Transcript_1201/m.2647 type:complete len:235 (-) Transcript_1201:201-905(-)